MVQRVKSLTRPERWQGNFEDDDKQRDIRHRQGRSAAKSDEEAGDLHSLKNYRKRGSMLRRKSIKCDLWTLFSRVLTCCLPDALISSFGVPNIQAWREKIALCFIILILEGLVAFVTFGLNKTFCPAETTQFRAFVANTATNPPTLTRATLQPSFASINGRAYRFTDVQQIAARQNVQLSSSLGGQDLSSIFTVDPTVDPCRPAACPDCDKHFPKRSCSLPGVNLTTGCLRFDQRQQPLGDIIFAWEEVDRRIDQLMVFNGIVLNLTEYLRSTQTPVSPADSWFVVDAMLRRNLGLDATISMLSTPQTSIAVTCMATRFRVGALDKESVGCGATSVILVSALVIVIGVIVVRFLMAITFSWFLSKGMVKIHRDEDRVDLDRTPNVSFPEPGSDATQLSPINANGDPLMYTMLLVTCYSEGETSMRGTLESLAETTYEEKYKMFFIIADGIIKGEGETKSTPDLCLSMLDVAPELRDPAPCSYIAIADGEKQHNMAKVYAGHFRHKTHRVPAILVVKCGTPSEANNPKPGNRGKRDSQVLLMNFLSRVVFDDRMTELDYDLFWKMQHLMKVTPDRFELVLMVDADTKVLPDSLSYMVRAMDKDPVIMGLCGETRIANKYDSWVTWIQVFEYYISHHLGKAFESVFGGVTCLPGCFCMYRIKARKAGAWVPILANPDIVQEYCQNVVDTLHKKNLLLLGEDRFLSTLMLRNFPKRQMVFVPQAICKTVVPDTFSVLLSQRRRWINSTIHNLLELVLVKDLCGIACLSMQFVVLMELIGTVTLPAAIVLSVFLIVSLAVDTRTEILPLVMLLSVLGLPAVLILLTTRKLVYVAWMFIYLLSLPVWNLLLPVYAFWHFDDFSWGQTRVVAGEGKGGGAGHGEKEGEFDTSAIVMRKWTEWERERRGSNAPFRNGSEIRYQSS